MCAPRLHCGVDGEIDHEVCVGKHARDDTRYGRNRMSATSYYVHHTQRLSRAAAWGDVNGIHESVKSARQHLMAGGNTEARAT